MLSIVFAGKLSDASSSSVDEEIEPEGSGDGAEGSGHYEGSGDDEEPDNGDEEEEYTTTKRPLQPSSASPSNEWYFSSTATPPTRLQNATILEAKTTSPSGAISIWASQSMATIALCLATTIAMMTVKDF